MDVGGLENKVFRPEDLDRDIWKVISLKLDGRSLCKLMAAWKWFNVYMMNDPSIWKELLIRDLFITRAAVAEDLREENWKGIYGSIFGNGPEYNPIYAEDDYQTVGARLGGVAIMSTWARVMLNRELNHEEMNQGYLVFNVLPGLWVADVYTGTCAFCQDVCEEIRTTFSLWHSKLHLMDGFDEFCPDNRFIKNLTGRHGVVIEHGADTLPLSNLSSKNDALKLQYKVSDHGVAFNCDVDNAGKDLEATISETKDKEGNVVAIQIHYLGDHPPSF